MSSLPIFCFLLLLLLLPPVHPIRVELPPYARGRIHALSTTSPFSAVASTNASFLSSTTALLPLFTHLSATLSHAHNASRPTLPICNVRPRNAFSTYLTNRGWPPTALSCVTHIFGLPSSALPAAVLPALLRRRAAITRALAPHLAARAKLNWTAAEHAPFWSYRRHGLSCALNNEPAFRINGLWYLRLQITNAHRDIWLPDWHRAYAEEFVRLGDDGKLETARMTLPVMGGDGELAVADATTAILQWRGASEPSVYGPHRISDNLALRDALDKAQLSMQQVQDATSASNVAILGLPLLLNLVPVAMVAHVSLPALIVYGVMSDVLTALPMAIKGLELMRISHRSFESVVTRMTDVWGDAESIAAEMWVAQCRPVDSVRPAGVIFLAVAVGMMLVGIGIDVLARVFSCCGRPVVAVKHDLREDRALLDSLEKAEEDAMSFEEYQTSSPIEGETDEAARRPTN